MSTNVDVVVVGGGTAGLQAALQLARVGRSVVVLERRPDGHSGARWPNGVVPWQFERAGLEPPQPPELRGRGGAAHLVSPSGAHGFTLTEGPVWEADMRELVARLRALALDAGVEIRWGVSDVRLELIDGRPIRAVADIDGDEVRVGASLFVDAGGRNGALRHQVPALAAICPPVADRDTCSAQQLILEVADRNGAQRFLDEHDASPGDSVIWVGTDGGYSTVNIGVEASLEEVGILAGSIPANGHATAPDIVKRVRAEQPWIGRQVFGGGGLIPLRRVYDRFTAPGVALVGDAACQVMAGHGSGIGFGLIAGKVLAEAVDGAVDAGDPDVLWGYQARYLREFGATLAAYDVVRRMSVRLGADGVEALYASGVFSPTMVAPGLDQRLGMLPPNEAARAARALAEQPAVARIVVPSLAAMSAARGLYRAYPKRRSPRAFRAWAASVRAALPSQDRA